MADIFDEVSEDLRRDRWLAVWKKYGVYVIGVALLVVLGAGGQAAWRYYDLRQQTARAALFDSATRAMRNGDNAAALADLRALQAKGDIGYGLLARLREAALLSAAGKREEAIAIYDGIAADSGLDELYRGLALLLSVAHRADSGDAAAELARLEPQLRPGAAWRIPALETAAALAVRLGKPEQAAGYLNSILETPDLSDATRNRVAEFLGALGPSGA